MKLIMIMGMQRSGTSALFETLSTDRRLVGHEESPDSPIYDDYFLRPETAIRKVLHSSRSPVLLKPVRETARRTLASVIDEYADYELSILWLYRDPVNVAFSYSVQGWLDTSTAELEWIALEWVALQWRARNRMVIELPAAYRPKLTVLQYEELVSNGSVLRALKRKLGIRGHSTLRPDSNAGRAQLPIVTQARIDAITSQTQLDLQSCPTGLDLGRRSSWKRCLALVNTDAGPRREDRGAAVGEGLRANAVIDFESEGFQREPHACLRRLREYGRHHRSASGHVQWLSEYDEVSCALHDSKRFNFQESSLLKDSPGLREERLRDAIAGAAIHDGSNWTATSLEDLALEALTRQAATDQFNLSEVCVTVVAAMFYRMLGVGSDGPDGLFERIRRGESIGGLSSQFLREGWMSRVAMQASLSGADLRRFLEFGTYYHYVTAIFASTAVHFLLGEPAVMTEVRRAPYRFRDMFTELARLAYPLLVVERWTNDAVEIAGRKILANNLVFLSIGAANRDPAAFERPDEFVMGRDLTTTKKPLTGFGGACFPRAHWEDWGHLACEALLKVLLTKLPLLEPVHPLAESRFTITESRGALRQALQIPFLRYLRVFQVKLPM
jgi:hypothetical protein